MPLLESSNPGTTLVGNQNLLNVKFRVNKFQDNLLSKRLQQLDSEEMKLRLKHQRTSNELIFFLRECQKTTGYLSKMKSFQSSSLMGGVGDDESSLLKNNQTSSTFESKSTFDINSRRASTATKSRSNSQTNSSNFNSSSALSGKDLLMRTRKKNSLDETKIESLNTYKNRLDIKSNNIESKNKIPLFEHILQAPNIRNSSGSSQCSNNSNTNSSLSKPPVSSRSNSSTFSSNSSESLNEICKISLKKIRPITSHVGGSRDMYKRRIDAEKRPDFNSVSTLSNIDWVSSINFEMDHPEINRKKNIITDMCSIETTTTKIVRPEIKIRNPNNKTNLKLENTMKNLRKKNYSSASKEIDFNSKSLNFMLQSNKSDFSTVNSYKSTQLNSNHKSTPKSPIKRKSLVNNNNNNNSINYNSNSVNIMTTNNNFNTNCNINNNNSNSNNNNSPNNNNKQNFPIKINMSRSYIKKKQLEIMNEYNHFNTLELLNNLRKIQHDLDDRVKQFTKKNIQESPSF